MLTAIQLAALRSVSDPKRLPHPAASHAHGNTLRSLERKGLVEHTSLGWRLTESGSELLNARAARTEGILLDESTLVSTLAESITCQMRAKLSVELTERQALDIARNVAQAVIGLEVDETHVVDAPELIDTRSLLSNRETHHDRCLAPFDDEHRAV